MQQIVNGVKTEKHLCAACSMTQEMPISLENLFQGLLDSILSIQAGETGDKKTPPPSVKCPDCGMTYEMFKSGGKLGCAECYHTFASELNGLLKNVQGSVKHEGKFPRRTGSALKQRREIDRLRIELTKAVETENFEEAASLRDRIRLIEAKPESEAGI